MQIFLLRELLQRRWPQYRDRHAWQAGAQSRVLSGVHVGAALGAGALRHRAQVVDGVLVLDRMGDLVIRLGQQPLRRSAPGLHPHRQLGGDALGERVHNGVVAANARAWTSDGEDRWRRLGVGLGLGMFGPRLDHQLRIEARDDRARALAAGSRVEPVDVIEMSMRYDDRLEAAPRRRLDVIGDFRHQAARRILGMGGGAKVDEHVPVGRGVVPRQQDAVTEADVVDANGYARWFGRHLTTPRPPGCAGWRNRHAHGAGRETPDSALPRDRRSRTPRGISIGDSAARRS